MDRRTSVRAVLIVGLLIALAVAGGAVSDTHTKSVRIRDDCEPASFDAALGPGACVGDGKTTFADFIRQLTADQHVEAWRFNPPNFDVVPDKVLLLESVAGETHTFTKVADFGGGFVPRLNALSGNPIPRPECAVALSGGGLAPQPPSATNIFVRAGETNAGPTAGSSILPVGETSKFQCCIHPWMRVVVRVPDH